MRAPRSMRHYCTSNYSETNNRGTGSQAVCLLAHLALIMPASRGSASHFIAFFGPQGACALFSRAAGSGGATSPPFTARQPQSGQSAGVPMPTHRRPLNRNAPLLQIAAARSCARAAFGRNRMIASDSRYCCNRRRRRADDSGTAKSVSIAWVPRRFGSGTLTQRHFQIRAPSVRYVSRIIPQQAP